MEIRQLEYFRAVVEEGTVSGAAKVLKMTQPPVSYQMKMLEEELNVQLFFRGTKKITLTEAGKVLYARSGSILKMLDVRWSRQASLQRYILVLHHLRF